MANEPETVAPEQQYLGVVCKSCGKQIPLAGPLDPVLAPPDKPMRVGARGPLPADCPHCAVHNVYTVEELRRVRAP